MGLSRFGYGSGKGFQQGTRDRLRSFQSVEKDPKQIFLLGNVAKF
jgi:hypothetical protein